MKAYILDSGDFGKSSYIGAVANDEAEEKIILEVFPNAQLIEADLTGIQLCNVEFCKQNKTLKGFIVKFEG